jgi:hypothetical protein
VYLPRGSLALHDTFPSPFRAPLCQPAVPRFQRLVEVLERRSECDVQLRVESPQSFQLSGVENARVDYNPSTLFRVLDLASSSTSFGAGSPSSSRRARYSLSALRADSFSITDRMRSRGRKQDHTVDLNHVELRALQPSREVNSPLRVNLPDFKPLHSLACVRYQTRT